MRTIKFRGKRIDKDVFVFGDMLTGMGYKKGKFYILPHLTYYPGDCNSLDGYEVVPETVGQFTGITDKNGKEIYEGDIIGCHNPDIKHLIFYNEKQGRFMAALNGDIDNDFVGVCGLDDSRWNASKEVIGNIHDNPELLKGGAE